MNTWIKPSELPKDFWSECFVAIHHEGEFLVEINLVSKHGDYSVWFYSESEQEWFEFNRDESDIRVMIIEYPEISLEDFEC